MIMLINKTIILSLMIISSCTNLTRKERMINGWIYRIEDYNVYGDLREITNDTVKILGDTLINRTVYYKIPGFQWLEFKKEEIKYFDLFNGFDSELYPKTRFRDSFYRKIVLGFNE